VGQEVAQATPAVQVTRVIRETPELLAIPVLEQRRVVPEARGVQGPQGLLAHRAVQAMQEQTAIPELPETRVSSTG